MSYMILQLLYSFPCSAKEHFLHKEINKVQFCKTRFSASLQHAKLIPGKGLPNPKEANEREEVKGTTVFGLQSYYWSRSDLRLRLHTEVLPGIFCFLVILVS